MYSLRHRFTITALRRVLATLAGLLLAVQFAAAGHLHLPGKDADDGLKRALCEWCIAVDRAGPAPAHGAGAVPPPATTALLPLEADSAPTTAPTRNYSSRAPPDLSP